MSGVRLTSINSLKILNSKLIDTDVHMLKRARYFTGRLQFLTTAASPAPIQSTKLTQSLRPLSLKMTARALRHKFAENYQVTTDLKCSKFLTQTILGKSAAVIVFMAQFSAQILVRT